MSGHSKWAQIKRQKGAADVKRGQAFTKLANAITVAVRDGGGVSDPNQNFKLRLIIEKARQVNMPKENIERAIHRALGKQAGSSLDEAVYEGFGPGGTAVVVEAATDNKQRTASEIKQIFDKNGGTLGNPGSVSYQFTLTGQLSVKKNKSVDEIFLIAADAGASDVEEAGDEVLIYTKPEELNEVKGKIMQAGLEIVSMELARKPTISVAISDKNTADKVLSFVEKLEGLDDVQKVYANFDIPDNLLA